MRNRKEAKCIYPNIKKWCDENTGGSLGAFLTITGQGHNGYPWLKGKYLPRKDTIDTVLEVTGMKYEEAFATDV